MRWRALLIAGCLLPLCAGAFDLQGHRGARGLAPENTLAAFRSAQSIGVTTLETDLAMTLDGVLVLSHDPRLNPALVRGPDGRWIAVPTPAIRSLTLEQLASYDVGRLNPADPYAAQWTRQVAVDGERVPTLVALFALARNARSPSGKPVGFNLETKITPSSADETPDVATFTQAIVAAVKAEGMSGRVTIQSFDWRTLVAVKHIEPALRTACLTIESENFDTVRASPGQASPWHAGLRRDEHGSIPALVKAAGCETWSPFWRNVTPDLVRDAHQIGVRVLPWTVNDGAAIERMIVLGVDGLITDYPDRARAIVEARGLKIE